MGLPGSVVVPCSINIRETTSWGRWETNAQQHNVQRARDFGALDPKWDLSITPPPSRLGEYADEKTGRF